MILAGVAGIFFAAPTAVFAIGGQAVDAPYAPVVSTLFTPASVDPALARRVADDLRSKGLDLRFTPASNMGDRMVTVAVRVDDSTAQAITARAIGVRSFASNSQAQSGTASVAIAPTRYNLGIARGYQGFAQSSELAGSPLTPSATRRTGGKPSLASVGLPSSIKPVNMPDLADFKPSPGAADKPSRFKSRIALDKDTPVGRSPQTREGLGDQSFDLGGAYRVTRNLDVTAGVRLTQDRDRLDPVTDDVQDSQAVYVGTQFRF